MALLTVFSNDLSTSQPNLSDRFKDATAFYISTPLSTDEMEIDVFLQIYIPTVTGERVRNIPFGKIEETALLLNITDTETMVTIPDEYVGSGLEMALLFLASDSVFMEAHALGKNCTLCTIDAKLDEILSLIESIGDGDFKDAIIQFVLENILPLLINAILPGLDGIVVSIVTNLLLPAIQDLLTGGGTPVLPPGGTPALPPAANSISLLGANLNNAANSIARNSTNNIRFT